MTFGQELTKPQSYWSLLVHWYNLRSLRIWQLSFKNPAKAAM